MLRTLPDMFRTGFAAITYRTNQPGAGCYFRTGYCGGYLPHESTPDGLLPTPDGLLPPELQAIVDLGDHKLMERVHKKKGISEGLAQVIQHRLTSVVDYKPGQPDKDAQPAKAKPKNRAGRDTEDRWNYSLPHA